MKELLISIAGIIGGVIGTFVVQNLTRRRQFKERVVSLRNEIEANYRGAESIFHSLNYLRDDEWKLLKEQGFVAYLKPEIGIQIAALYDQMHSLNQRITRMRELDAAARKKEIQMASPVRAEFMKQATGALDTLPVPTLKL